MEVRFTKGRHAETMTCVRADGSVEVFRRAGERRGFFVLHDLLHLAVESVLGYREGFFGLIASGWSVADFERKGAVATLPRDAIWAEHIVGAIQVQLVFGMPDAAALVAGIRTALASAGRMDAPAVSQEQLDAIVATYGDLVTRWRGVAEGDALELTFPRARPA